MLVHIYLVTHHSQTMLTGTNKFGGKPSSLEHIQTGESRPGGGGGVGKAMTQCQHPIRERGGGHVTSSKPISVDYYLVDHTTAVFYVSARAHGSTSHPRTTVGSTTGASNILRPPSPQMGRNFGAKGDSTPLERPVPAPIQPNAVEIPETPPYIQHRAISRTVSRMMKKILNRKVSEEVLAVTEYIPTLVTPVEEECVPVGPKVRPTLHVHRHAGTFYVSMYPVDQDLERAPLQFKIPTSRGQECKEDEQGRPISCRSSDLEVEVVSPAALVPKPVKKSVRHVDTQYDDNDIPSPVKEAMEEQSLEHKENNHNGKIKIKNGNLKLRNGYNINKHDKSKDGNNSNMKKDPELSKNVGEDVPVLPPLGMESDELLLHVEMEQNGKKGNKVEFGTKGHGYYYY
ncbi:unnamed protein product [Timema podura]|uniref:Uncharacterized protein n=1 Tax=Timema podura TaxID=61482 RepID=A0ABN7P2T5_TIMPD|nr:unnamed protein product [Timema podura]